jgi:hypothetical protein
MGWATPPLRRLDVLRGHLLTLLRNLKATLGLMPGRDYPTLRALSMGQKALFLALLVHLMNACHFPHFLHLFLASKRLLHTLLNKPQLPLLHLLLCNFAPTLDVVGQLQALTA